MAINKNDINVNAVEQAIANSLEEFYNSLLEKIDKIIDENLTSWKRDRISRTALAVLRLAVYEIMFESDTPNKVAANEAIELSKKYSTKEESAYINGILGSVISNSESAD